MFRWLKSTRDKSGTNYLEIDANNTPEEKIIEEEKSTINPFSPGAPSKSTPPALPGSYRIVNKTDRTILYIGVTINLNRRRNEHQSSGKLLPDSHDFKWKLLNEGATLEELYRHECMKIKKHNPENNSYAGGNGRRGELPWDRK